MNYKCLQNKVQIPSLGFGVFQISEKGATKKAVIDAIKAGYRLIDTAASYGNEREVGNGIKEAISQGIVTRDELFITSKLWVEDVSAEKAPQAIKNSLNRLQLDYLDLLLIHQPYNDVFGAWRAMENAYSNGLIKSIGVSNFDIAQITNLAEFSKIKPMVNQIEVNPFNQNINKVDYLQKYGIQVEAWAPFAEGKHELLKNELLKEIGDKYDKSIAQVILRWLYQRNVIPLSKSVKEARMEQNLDVLDFELSDEDIKKIETLNRNESQFFDHHDPDMIKWMANRKIEY
ncbi:aldo/keto reductase [Apilactobacillus timberlakei]|uniref:Aldo/keto reductase n=1 Tax=Apilactobacillus timberlakei TaxID=2008380 RepID=A0ABY2YV81_9LACO|nr:aldo/keto reductase [Apilactobacillus timberlakei]TPR12305.1 aldo/keto reductase [Apilactobacillus timberlakei]TPR12908.1 aldo/keto reductase [Apilactobacillus timberlakei]